MKCYIWLKWQIIVKQQLQAGKHRGILFLFSRQREMDGFLSLVSELRLQLLVQGDKPRYRLVEIHCQRN